MSRSQAAREARDAGLGGDTLGRLVAGIEAFDPLHEKAYAAARGEEFIETPEYLARVAEYRRSKADEEEG